MAKEPQNYTQKDIKNAQQAASEYIGNPKPLQRPKNVKEQVKDDWSAVKENFTPRKKSANEKRIVNPEKDRRTSSMPGAARNKDFASSKKDIASQFGDSYSKAGIQPQSNLDRPAQKGSRSTETVAANQTIQQQPQPVQTRRGLVAPGVRTASKRKRLKKRGIARRAVTKVRVSAVNVWLWAWGGWAWFWFQVPIAILSIVFMGLTQIIYDLFAGGSTGTDTDSGDSFAVIAGRVFWGVASLFAGLAQYVASWLGIDLSIFNPGGFFLMTHLIVFFIGISTLILCYIQYKIAFINPLGGNKMGMKMGALMMAILFYGIPILNLFPWFFLWTFVVWMYPK